MANASKKKRRVKAPVRKANGGSAPALPVIPEDVEIMIAGAGDAMPAFDPAQGAIEIPDEDGTITIQLGSPEQRKKNTSFDANLAEELDSTVLGRISNSLLEAIEQDERDRSEWIQQRADGLDLLGQKVERPGTGNVGSASTAVPGQSTVRDGILSEAVDMFQANAFAELCPSDGPCKAVNYGDETTDADKLARDFEKDFNFYLTGSGPGTAKEYYPDTRRMLWWTGYASGMFKKVYACPLRRRPVSESVDGADLIIPSNATDLANAGRITHQINMRQSVMKRMQILGIYRDVSLTQPTSQPNVLAQKEGTITGLNPNPQRVEDQDYTVFECYCELDIDGFEHTEKGKPTGLPLPYRVTLDKDSRQILEIRRNWKEDDEDQQAKIPFVAFPYTDNIGIYGTGLLHRLGNYTMALTAMLRECIDAGMFASFPGFLYAKPAGRQLQNEFRVPPGGGAPIDVSAVGGNINNAVIPLPYKDVSTAMVALMEQTRNTAFRYGGMANTGVGEGKQDAPVGTTLALIEQATKIDGGVHKALHAAQKEELLLLKELFRDDPEALWRGNRRPAMGNNDAMRLQRFTQALENCELVPASDPNVPSNMHRIAKANALLQTAMGLPGMFNMQVVLARWGTMMKIDDVETMLMPPQQPQPDPMAQEVLALKAREVAVKENALQLKAQTDQAELHSKEQIEAAKLAAAHATGQQDTGRVKESISYKDAPPDIQRQMEQQAGMVPSQIQASPEQPPPDPLQAQALHLKGQQVQQAGTKMALDFHSKHADRQSKENIEAMKIGQALAVHPESQPVVNSELAGLSPYLKPTPSTPTPDGMSDGGPVGPDADHIKTMRDVNLALEIARALQDRSKAGYTH